MVSEMQAEEATYHFTGHKPALGPRYRSTMPAVAIMEYFVVEIGSALLYVSSSWRHKVWRGLARIRFSSAGCRGQRLRGLPSTPSNASSLRKPRPTTVYVSLKEDSKIKALQVQATMTIEKLVPR